MALSLALLAGLGCGDRAPPAVWPRPEPPSVARPLPAEAPSDEEIADGSALESMPDSDEPGEPTSMGRDAGSGKPASTG